MTYTVSDNFFTIVKQFEGLSLKPYLCPAGVPTIGYGSTTYPDGKKVTLKDKEITIEEAQDILVATVTPIIKTVEKYVKCLLCQNQLDAIVDFIYNVGSGNFASSTLLKKINIDQFDTTIRNEFMKWDKATINGIKKSLPGLTKRRKAEADLYELYN